MHVDLDYFYAQCEENRDPSIRNRPVVVCVYSGRTEESGVVSTSNYVAREYGVKAGMPIVRAKRLLKSTEAVFLPMNRPLYEGVSERVMTVLREHADLFEQAGIDEAYLEVTKRTQGSFAKAHEIASEIKQRVLENEHITCSVGIAPNKLIGKICSDYRKPNGLTSIVPNQVQEFIAELPVAKIPGVGKKAEEKLSQLNIRTVRELHARDRTSLVESFGNNLGTFLYHAARGENDEPVKERDQPSQFSRIATLRKDTSDTSEMMPLLDELTSSVAQRLREADLTCKSVGIVAILNDLAIHSRSKTLDSPTSDTNTIAKNIKELARQFFESMPNAVARRVGVKVSVLTKKSEQTDISKFLHE